MDHQEQKDPSPDQASIEDRIQKLRVQSGLEEEKPKESLPKSSKSTGGEFLASVFAGALLGYGVDYFLNTAPWGLIFMIVMGFVSGVYRANQTMQKNNKKR